MLFQDYKKHAIITDIYSFKPDQVCRAEGRGQGSWLCCGGGEKQGNSIGPGSQWMMILIG